MHNEMKASESNLYNHVEYLTEIYPPKNYLNIDSLNMAANYIAYELKNNGCRIDKQIYKANDNKYVNIIGSLGPKEASRVIVGAHYDVVEGTPGADDNASAVAGLIETARLLAPFEEELTKRINFVAYSLEEPPFFVTKYMGSAVHASSLRRKSIPVEFMVCYEMIGYFDDKPGSQRFPYPSLASQYPDTGDFIIVVGIEEHSCLTDTIADLMIEGSKIRVERINFPSPDSLAGLSDQINYWANGYPAVMINDTSYFRNNNYHKPTDTIDTLNFSYMAEVVNGVSFALKTLAVQ